jgi:hypothetical protein
VVTLRVIVRGVRRLVVVVLVAAAVRNVLGVWLGSVVLTGWGLCAGLRAWSRLEDRLDRRSRARVPEVIDHRPRRRAVSGPEHVAFARGLAAVSAAYLDHCEQEANTP